MYFAGRPIHEITTPELDRWIRSLNVSGTTRNSYKRVLGVLFGFAVRMEYSLKNPARGIEKASEQITKPGILTFHDNFVTRAKRSCHFPELSIESCHRCRPG